MRGIRRDFGGFVPTGSHILRTLGGFERPHLPYYNIKKGRGEWRRWWGGRVEVSGEGGGGEWRRWWGGGVLEFYPRLSFLIWAAVRESKP